MISSSFIVSEFKAVIIDLNVYVHHQMGTFISMFAKSRLSWLPLFWISGPWNSSLLLSPIFQLGALSKEYEGIILKSVVKILAVPVGNIRIH